MITSVFGAAWGSCFPSQKVLRTLSIFEKNRFFDEKNGIFEFQPLWAGKQKTHFFGQKIDFFQKP